MTTETANTYELLFQRLLEMQELTKAGLSELRDELDANGPGNLIQKILDLHVNSERLAAAVSEVFNTALYPHALKPSQISPDAPPPALPKVIAHGDGHIFCSNRVLYLVNPFDRQGMRNLASRYQSQNMSGFGVIAKAQYLLAAGEAAPSPGAPAGAGELLTPERRKLDSLLLQAVRVNASDIHFEPQANDTRVRLRVDSVLREVARYPHEEYKAIANVILSRCKSGKPGTYLQVLDDMFVFDVPPNRRVKKRVMMVPATIPGQQDDLPVFCLRILGNNIEQRSLRELGIPDTEKNPQLTRVRLLCERKNGLILVSGPTGSGKTTTLAAVLSEMQRAHPDRCRYTAEDPVEMNLVGVNHIQINEEAGLTFARAVKSFLRGDPDEILIGEIRELEVARQALTASITGHLVFSTIHTNSAIECVSRLIDMGCDHYIVASALKAAMAQRLVRKVCPKCSAEARWGSLIDGSNPYLEDPDNAIKRLHYMNAAKVYTDLADYPRSPDAMVRLANPAGCPACGNTGYRGRMLVTELIEISPRIAHLISKRESTFALLRQAKREGFMEMWEHAATLIFKLKTTTFDEMIEALGEREAGMLADIDDAPALPPPPPTPAPLQHLKTD